MTFENNSDTECITQADCFSADDFISQSINEGLFIAQRNNLGDRDQEITENHTFPNSSTSSEVEYTLTFSCFYATNEIDILELYKAFDRRIHLRSKRRSKEIDVENGKYANKTPQEKQYLK